MTFRFACTLLLWFSLSCGDFSREAVADRYTRDVQSILSEHCLVCHGADVAEGGLRLDRRHDALAELDSGARAIVPGNVSESELLARVRTDDPAMRMPPEGEPLSASEIKTLEAWIRSGADWRQHWAYRRLDPGPLPQVNDPAWCRSPVDRYVLARLETIDVRPSPDASRAKLIRRLSYDLLGFPPTVAQIERFVADRSADAYSQLVDQLLHSPRFGERWGRHWLDKARYADSDGYEKDRNRPRAWRYRDWVIEAINRDMPFDRFTIEQLAGDLLPHASDDQLLATAFHRQTLTNTEGGTDPEQWRVAAVMDRTETLGTVWLGLTVGCARCHNHKYDQITQAEYYRLYAFFNNADETQHDLPPTNKQLENYQAKLRQHRDQLAAYRRELRQLQERKTKQRPENGPQDHSGSSGSGEKEDQSTTISQQIADLKKAIAELEKEQPQRPTFPVRVVGERTKDRRVTHILRRGEFKQPTQPVQAATPDVLPPPRSGQSSDDDALDRLALARWLVDGHNPLVARVVANHVWQNLFGKGLVTTPNDFGVRGDPPSHPKLLDYLATEYVRQGWSRKQMIRQIVLSATYRQASDYRPELQRRDPQNRLLARQNRYRLEAEVLRDITLSVAGLLSSRIGGPSVFPPMPPEAAAVSYANNFKWQTSQGENRYRRGMYTFFKRTAPHPTLMTFDCPDANVTNVQRNRSNTPIGALVLLNNEVYSEAASAWAARLLSLPDLDERDRIAMAFRACMARQATGKEIDALQVLLEESRRYYVEHRSDAAECVGRHTRKSINVAEHAAWTNMARAILNLDEFFTRD